MYQEYSDTQVLQTIGRAGRPQFDTGHDQKSDQGMLKLRGASWEYKTVL